MKKIEIKLNEPVEINGEHFEQLSIRPPRVRDLLMDSWAMFRNLIQSLSRAFQEGDVLALIWLISFVWILIAFDQPITLGAVIAAALAALAAAWLLGLLIGLPVVLLDGLLDIMADVRRDIRAASDTTGKPPRRPLP